MPTIIFTQTYPWPMGLVVALHTIDLKPS